MSELPPLHYNTQENNGIATRYHRLSAIAELSDALTRGFSIGMMTTSGPAPAAKTPHYLYIESVQVPTDLTGTPQTKKDPSQGIAADDPRAKRPWRFRAMDICRLQAQNICGDSSARPAEYLPRLFQDGKMRPYEALASPRRKPSCREPRFLQWFTHRGSWKKFRSSVYNMRVLTNQAIRVVPDLFTGCHICRHAARRARNGIQDMACDGPARSRAAQTFLTSLGTPNKWRELHHVELASIPDATSSSQRVVYPIAASVFDLPKEDQCRSGVCSCANDKTPYGKAVGLLANAAAGCDFEGLSSARKLARKHHVPQGVPRAGNPTGEHLCCVYRIRCKSDVRLKSRSEVPIIGERSGKNKRKEKSVSACRMLVRWYSEKDALLDPSNKLPMFGASLVRAWMMAVKKFLQKQCSASLRPRTPS
ncbi:uncharacterized protein CLUP02_15971 [Colletotrichum lupini]|uniref:Uncharacterized protein n=1 Tax=Colletotrichum lupini TaxID=145971 RepID=A0A9Q8WP80_9PEZI|nr:uncharacterized protein CLUP02_15971 [Colletotrichum lupini]UQC90441.1 hypothetical protein CLUP02_15971 [Colletotrichum lupini]